MFRRKDKPKECKTCMFFRTGPLDEFGERCTRGLYVRNSRSGHIIVSTEWMIEHHCKDRKLHTPKQPLWRLFRRDYASINYKRRYKNTD